MEDDDTVIPRSARIKFTLNPSKAVEQTPEYAILKEETDAVISQVHNSLRLQIIKLTKQEVTAARRTLQDTFASALRLTVQTASLYEPGIGHGQVDQICSTLISQYHHDLLKHLHTNVESFRATFIRIHALQGLPAPFADHLLYHPVAAAAGYNDDEDPALGYDILGLPPPRNRRRQQAPPTNLLRAVQNLKQLLLNVFNDPWFTFCKTEQQQNIDREVLRLTTTYFDTTATAEAAMIVDQEPAVEPRLLQEIIKKHVDSSTKTMQQEIKNLRNELRQKSTQRGPSSSASNKKKIVTQQPSPNAASNKSSVTKNTQKNTKKPRGKAVESVKGSSNETSRTNSTQQSKRNRKQKSTMKNK